eukprot:7998915-Karenia_brevis.AAC.1
MVITVAFNITKMMMTTTRTTLMIIIMTMIIVIMGVRARNPSNGLKKVFMMVHQVLMPRNHQGLH